MGFFSRPRYSGRHIGSSLSYALIKQEDCDFTLGVGHRTMIKRKRFEEYIEKVYSI
ncbi:excisionase [Oscillospiraceae bacterium LCP25S3_F9]